MTLTGYSSSRTIFPGQLMLYVSWIIPLRFLNNQENANLFQWHFLYKLQNGIQCCCQLRINANFMINLIKICVIHQKNQNIRIDLAFKYQEDARYTFLLELQQTQCWPQMCICFLDITKLLSFGSYQIRKIVSCTCVGDAGDIFSATYLKGNRWLSIPTCITVGTSCKCHDACRNR